jgi:hypothetical protein
MIAGDLLKEIRSRNIDERILQDIQIWQNDVTPESKIFFVNQLLDKQMLRFTIGDDRLTFYFQYGDEPYTFSSEEEKLKTWIIEANRYTVDGTNLYRLFWKVDVVYCGLFPKQNEVNETNARIERLNHDIILLKEIAPPYVAKDIEDAAFGAMIGGIVGEAAGAPLEMLYREPTPEEVKRAMAMSGGGFHRVSPGQITDDGELSLCQAHCLVTKLTLNNLVKKYVDWLTSGPFDIGGTIFRALSCHNLFQYKNQIQEQGLGPTVIQCAYTSTSCYMGSQTAY